MSTPSGFSIPPKTLSNVDYYSKLLNDAPEVFLKVVEKNNFEPALIDEMNNLVEEVKKRRMAAGENEPLLLASELFCDLRLESEVEKEMVLNFSAMEDYLEEISNTEQQSIQTHERKKHFKFRNFIADPWTDPLEKEDSMCFLLVVHQRLTDMLETTVNPNQLHTISNHTPAVDNNSNDPHL